MSYINPISSAGATFASQGSAQLAAPLQQTGVGTTDTLAPSARPSLTNWQPQIPVLTPPYHLQESSDLRLLNVSEQSRTLGNDLLDSLGIRLQCVKEKIRDVSAEMIKKLKESAERANTSNFWSILQKVASCFLSAISIVFGISFLASGGAALVGGAMIASGILSLANFALAEYGTWDWIADQLSHSNEDTKRKIVTYLPMTVGIIAGGIGLVGTVNGVVNGTFELSHKIISVLQTTLTLFGAATTLGKGIADGRLLQTRAQLQMIQAGRTVQEEYFTSAIEEIKVSLNGFRAVKSKTKQAIEMITQSNIQLARQV